MMPNILNYPFNVYICYMCVRETHGATREEIYRLLTQTEPSHLSILWGELSHSKLQITVKLLPYKASVHRHVCLCFARSPCIFGRKDAAQNSQPFQSFVQRRETAAPRHLPPICPTVYVGLFLVLYHYIHVKSNLLFAKVTSGHRCRQ